MRTYSWLCRTELDRERMVKTVRWVGPARAAMFAILAIVIIGSARDTGWLALIPLVVCAVLSIALYRNLEQRARPEFWAAGGWLVTQTSLGVGIVMTGGPHSPALPWMAVAVISLIARFSRAGIIAGLAFLLLELAAITLGYAPTEVLNHPSEFLLPVGLLFSVGVFAAAQMRSDLDHRDFDKTTELANQQKFADELRLALLSRRRRGGSVAVLALDLDGFGLANTELGPRAGDALLREAGSRLVRAVREADLIARRSADEFLVLLTDFADRGGPQDSVLFNPRQVAQRAARAIRAEIGQPFVVDGVEVFLDVCVGITVLDDDAADPDRDAEQLLGEAQHALSAAQSASDGHVVFADQRPTSTGSQLAMISRIRRAIDQEQFVMHYQPTVNLHTGRLLGVEALMRWQDSDGTMISPGAFIPLLEETGLIDTVGAWGFTQICRQAKEWQDEGRTFDIAYNVSPRQLHQSDLLEQMIETIERSGVDPRHLIIEITESSALEDPEHAIRVMSELTRHGLRLAIDDFGVGLSSLSRLRDMPASFLKIDRSFVSDIETSPQGLAMVRTIVQLAENLSMEPHAEGVETERQRQILLETGCHQAQGFLFSKAIPAEDVLAYEARALCSALPDLNRIASA